MDISSGKALFNSHISNHVAPRCIILVPFKGGCYSLSGDSNSMDPPSAVANTRCMTILGSNLLKNGTCREAASPVSCKFFVLPVLQQRMPFPFCLMLLDGGGGSDHKIQGKSTQGYLLSFKGGSPASPQQGNLALGCDEPCIS